MKRIVGLLVAAALCLPTGASAWWKSIQQVGVSSVVTKGYTFLAGIDYQDNSSTQTVVDYAVTMTGVAGKLIVYTYAGGPLVSSVVYDPSGANVPLTRDAVSTGGQFSFYSANIPAATGSKNIEVTYVSNIVFLQEGAVIWLATGLVSGFDNFNEGSSSTSVTVNSGDFLFAVNTSIGGTPPNTWSGSTISPTASRLSTVLSPATQTSASADWSNPSSGGTPPFTFTVGNGSNSMMVATYK